MPGQLQCAYFTDIAGGRSAVWRLYLTGSRSKFGRGSMSGLNGWPPIWQTAVLSSPDAPDLIRAENVGGRDGGSGNSGTSRNGAGAGAVVAAGAIVTVGVAAGAGAGAGGGLGRDRYTPDIGCLRR